MTSHRSMPHNPDVQPQRAGYCVRSETLGWMTSLHLTWGKASEAMVFGTKQGAEERARWIHGARVTSVPRWCGHAWLFDYADEEAA